MILKDSLPYSINPVPKIPDFLSKNFLQYIFRKFRFFSCEPSDSIMSYVSILSMVKYSLYSEANTLFRNLVLVFRACVD